ncbi:MAG: hypothetical protein HYS07_03855 [Chlamydiae bacterium]|nr:hypothetical protein [Chlamydiota bacterium]
MNLKFEPSFIEEAVFIGIRSLEKRGDQPIVDSFHLQRIQIYEHFQGLEREKKFHSFFEEFFSKLGLRFIFENVISEFHLLNDSSMLLFVKTVWNRKGEGAQLYVDGNLKTVLLGLRIVGLENLLFFESFLRHELFHISDMLDPSFQYSTDADLGGFCEVENDLARDRFRLLWNIYITKRIIGAGHFSHITPDELRASFNKAFSSWSDGKQENVFQNLFSSRSLTQGELIQVAKEAESGKPGRRESFHCSLCGFPYLDKFNWEELEEKTLVINEIRKDFPEWLLSSSICRQCFELYLSKARVIHETA